MIEDLRKLSDDELVAKTKALREDVFKARFQHATSQLRDHTQIGKAKKELARALGVLSERKQQAAEEVSA
jgi:large subunit ribosomal protein L29